MCWQKQKFQSGEKEGYLDDANYSNFDFIASYLVLLQKKLQRIGFKILNIMYWLKGTTLYAGDQATE